MSETTESGPIVQVALNGLLGFLDDEQQRLIALLAGDDAPRTFDEVAALLQQEPATLHWQYALIARTLQRSAATPLPGTLRLALSAVVEGVSQDLTRNTVYHIHNLVPGLRAPAFPAVWPHFQVLNVWTGGPPGGSARAGVVIKDPTGTVLSAQETVVAFPGPGGKYMQLLYWREATFAEPGQYTLEVWLAGAPLTAYFFPVLPLPEPPPAPAEEVAA